MSTPSREDMQQLMEELEQDGLLERTGKMRDGLPVFRPTEAGRSHFRQEKWGAFDHQEVLVLFALVLKADGQELCDRNGAVPIAPPPDAIRLLADELGEVVSERGLAVHEDQD